MTGKIAILSRLVKRMKCIELKINQLHYSPKVIEYIKGKKDAEIESLRISLEKCESPKEYILSVYYYETKEGLDIYHVCGQEVKSDNAFILGALIDIYNKNDNIPFIGKLYIKGVIYDKNNHKSNTELSQLNEMFKGFTFKKNPRTNEIMPVFSLEGKLIKSYIRNNIDIGEIKIKNETKSDEEYIRDLKKRYEIYGYHDTKCPKGSPFCVHFCDYYDKITNGCTFKCPFDRDKCNAECKYYVDSRQLNCVYTKIKIIRNENI